MKKLTIEGLTCHNCVRHATEALKGVAGVSKVEVDLESKTAVVETDAAVKDETLCQTVSEAGYKVTKIE